MKIDWRKKLASRKLWALASALIISVLLIFRADADTIEKISGAVTALGAVVAYIMAEAKIDASAAGKADDAGEDE